MAEFDDEVDGLYDLAPREFVAARNALVKRIRAEGDKDRAAEVAGLSRPTIVAWALNRAARDDPERVDRLIDAASRQATAQSDLMAGGDAAELRSATAERRAAAGEIVRAAAAVAGSAHTDAVRNTLDAALAEPDLLERLRSGSLSETLGAPAGFGFGLDAAPVTPARSRPKAEAKAATASSALPDPQGQEEEARQKARSDAQAAVARLEAEASTVAAAMDAASADLEEADDEVREAEDALTAARLARGQAADSLSRARTEHERVASLLAEARRRLTEPEGGRPG